MASVRRINKTFSITEFEILFKEQHALLCKTALQYVRDPQTAEDIVHEVFLKLWENRDTVNIHTSIKSFVFRSVKNRSIDYLRKRYLETTGDSDDCDIAYPGQNDPAEILYEKEINDKLQVVLETLPERCYAIFSMKRFGNLSYKEIADKLGISVKTVENQMTIAIKKIKASMIDYLPPLILIMLFI
jgi:RNA polymerase sigma-70 factor (ECF subfamily)